MARQARPTLLARRRRQPNAGAAALSALPSRRQPDMAHRQDERARLQCRAPYDLPYLKKTQCLPKPPAAHAKPARRPPIRQSVLRPDTAIFPTPQNPCRITWRHTAATGPRRTGSMPCMTPPKLASRRPAAPSRRRIIRCPTHLRASEIARTATDINQYPPLICMARRSMPVCFTTQQYRTIQAYAKSQGMLNASQALEDLLEKRQAP